MTHTVAPIMYPCFRYEDARKAMEWLSRAFGFETILEVPGEDGKLVHAEMSFGAGVFMLGSTRTEMDDFGQSPRALGGVTGSVYIYVADLDTHYKRARSAGAEIVLEPYDEEYGRGYSARDLEGQLWSFGTYRPSASG